MDKTKSQKFNEQFDNFLKEANLEITAYDPDKERTALKTSLGRMSLKKFQEALRTGPLAAKVAKFQRVQSVLYAPDVEFARRLIPYLEDNGLVKSKESRGESIPEAYRDLVLNMDHTHVGRDIKFFMTTPDEFISPVAGPAYLASSNISYEEAVHRARKVSPRYMPRRRAGIHKLPISSGGVLDHYNTYVPPSWKRVTKEGVRDKLPVLFKKLVWHLFPLESEREYFFAWLYKSLFDRSYVYMILCGIPGSGKNRLKLVLRALHGHSNSVDGKKASLVDRFNSQFSESTLVWFDELRHNSDMENVLKELQNDSISIERKGVDATKSTQIHASFVISNNKPRDNYLAFDARKFAPLVVANKRLETSMTEDQIDRLTNKVEKEDHPDFDPKFLLQIARWVKRNAKPEKFPNLEYRGPMFWKLCHTSMSRWQKIAASTILSAPEDATGRMQFIPKKGFKWSTVEDMLSQKKKISGEHLTDYSTVKYFFDVFRDGVGNAVFETLPIKGDIMGDFYVRVINKEAKILTEADVLAEIGGLNDQGKEKDDSEKEESVLREAGTANSGRGSGLNKKTKKGRRDSAGTRPGISGKYRKVKNLA